MLTSIFQIFKCKFNFKKPKKSKYLLFDRARNDFLSNYQIFLEFQILDLRFESVNLVVLFETIFKTGFNNLSKNYIKNYIINVDPKVIVTFTDYNPTFFLLKDLVKEKKFKTIAIQSSFRTIINYEAFKKDANYNYKCDYYLYLDEYSKRKIIEKIITAKFYEIGSFKNNLIKIKKKIKKKYDILFISQFKSSLIRNKNLSLRAAFESEKKYIHWIHQISRKYNFIFKIAINKNISGKMKKLKKRKKEYINFFKLIKPQDILGENKNKNNYNHVDESKIIIFINSTLGLEAFSRGSKILSCPLKPYSNKKEFFWSTSYNYLDFSNKIKQILFMNKKRWDTLTKSSPLKIKYDYNNKTFFKILNKCVR